jgi:tetratricopeptide (TPR) repeat protein
MAGSLRRRLLLVLVYLAVPALFVAAELVLRSLRPDLRPPFVREVTTDGAVWWELQRGALDRYFDRSSPLVPEFKPALLRKQKGETFRVVCLGGSTMFGTPYQMTANIPGLVRRQLRAAQPGRPLEVLNLGASAINSTVIRDLLPEVAALEPDLVLVYMGHNEFYGPDGVGAGWLERRIPPLIPLKYRLRDLALYRWLLPRTASSGERNLMREVSRSGAVRSGSDDEAFVLSQFERNLSGILEFWRERGVPVVVSDVASNLRFPPFMADTTGADSANAALLFRRASRLLAEGDSVGASGLFGLARDHDLLKFRAPSAINGIIRRVVSSAGAGLVSTDSLFARLSGGVPGDELFWEHLHPTLRGYHEIALLFTDTIVSRGLAGAPPVRSRPLPFLPESLAVCWLDRAYGDLSIAHLTGRWPFTDYRREPEVLGAGTAAGLRRIAQSVYDRAIPWDKGCYESAAWFWGSGDLASAQTTYEALLEEHPDGFYAQYLLGNLLAKRGEVERAEGMLEGSVRSNPSYPNARLDLGLLLINAGRFSEALVHLEAGARLPEAGKSRQTLSLFQYGIGAAHANAGEYEAALKALEESLRLVPGNADAQRLMASVRSAMQKRR